MIHQPARYQRRNTSRRVIVSHTRVSQIEQNSERRYVQTILFYFEFLLLLLDVILENRGWYRRVGIFFLQLHGLCAVYMAAVCLQHRS